MDDLTEDDLEFYDERAGIAEFDGGLSRDDAEKQAWGEMLELKKQLTGDVYENAGQ